MGKIPKSRSAISTDPGGKCSMACCAKLCSLTALLPYIGRALLPAGIAVPVADRTPVESWCRLLHTFVVAPSERYRQCVGEAVRSIPPRCDSPIFWADSGGLDNTHLWTIQSAARALVCIGSTAGQIDPGPNLPHFAPAYHRPASVGASSSRSPVEANKYHLGQSCQIAAAAAGTTRWEPPANKDSAMPKSRSRSYPKHNVNQMFWIQARPQN